MTKLSPEMAAAFGFELGVPVLAPPGLQFSGWSFMIWRNAEFREMPWRIIQGRH